VAILPREHCLGSVGKNVVKSVSGLSLDNLALACTEKLGDWSCSELTQVTGFYAQYMSGSVILINVEKNTLLN